MAFTHVDIETFTQTLSDSINNFHLEVPRPSVIIYIISISDVWMSAEAAWFPFSFLCADGDALSEVPERGAGDGPLAWQQFVLRGQSAGLWR